jgi:hypothetical protein
MQAIWFRGPDSSRRRSWQDGTQDKWRNETRPQNLWSGAVDLPHPAPTGFSAAQHRRCWRRLNRGHDEMDPGRSLAWRARVNSISWDDRNRVRTDVDLRRTRLLDACERGPPSVSWTSRSNCNIFIVSESRRQDIISNLEIRENHQRESIPTGIDICKKGYVSISS